MNKILSVFVVTSVIGHAAFAMVSPHEVKDGRSFVAALELNKNIQKYIRGTAPATPQLLVEILTFLEAVDARQIGLQPKTTDMLALAEEVGDQLKTLDPKLKAQLQPIMDSLLSQYRTGPRKRILLRMFDRFWFWTTNQLDFMARQIRNDNSYLISTQAMWILDRATPEQRQSFFAQIPDKKPNRMLRWFSYALAYKYGQKVDLSDFRRTLNLVNPERLRPQSRPIVLDGVALPTTAELYSEAKLQIQNEPPVETCKRYLKYSSLIAGPR